MGICVVGPCPWEPLFPSLYCGRYLFTRVHNVVIASPYRILPALLATLTVNVKYISSFCASKHAVTCGSSTPERVTLFTFFFRFNIPLTVTPFFSDACVRVCACRPVSNRADCFHVPLLHRVWQVALDRAAHLMDAVAFGHQDWDGVREELAEASVSLSIVPDTLAVFSLRKCFTTYQYL